MNPMLNNELACYPAILARLKSVDGVTAVKEIADLTDLQALKPNARRLDNAVYVLFDGFRPLGDADNGRQQTEELSFSFILVKRHYVPSHSLYEQTGVGEMLTAIKKAFRGWEPKADDWHLTTTPFKQASALPIKYLDGFAYFPCRFTTTVAT